MSATNIHLDRLKAHARDVATRLRDLAEQVELQTGKLDRIGQPGVPNYAAVAASIQHAVLWGVANLNLSELTGLAATADNQRFLWAAQRLCKTCLAPPGERCADLSSPGGAYLDGDLHQARMAD